MKESYKLVESLNKNRLKPLIDSKKLLFSPLYSEALSFAIEQFLTHKNLTCLETLINVFEDRQYKLFAAHWVEERLGLKCSAKAESYRLSRTDALPNDKLSLKVSLELFAKNGFKSKESPKPSMSKPSAGKAGRKGAKRVDMLDSWARLPGCYGTGKRQ